MRWLLLALFALAIATPSHAQFTISVGFAPPALPVYVQPMCPQPNLMWTPGYWAYGPEGGYFWVPGAWVPAPYGGALWTPPYWGYNNGQFGFHQGYWGMHVGFYGGVNYGFGFGGIGFAGGEWRNGGFAYNTAVVNVNTTVIHTTFVDRTVIERSTVVNANHVAYSGGPGGVQHVATPEERIAEHETHTAPTSFQTQHISAAQTNKQSYAKANGGHPTTLAVAKPLQVESHPAPPKAAVTAGAKGSVTPMPGRPSTEVAGHANTAVSTHPTTTTPPRTTELKTNNSANGAVRANTAPRTYTPPKENVKPPPPPKQTPKTKPEGHEK